MTYAQFKQIIDLQIAHSQKMDKLYKLNINLIEAFDEQEKVIDPTKFYYQRNFD